MYNFTLQLPTTIHFGKGQISHLSELKQSGDHVLLVYGGGSIKRNGIYDSAMKILTDAGITVTELSGVEPNPKIETVRKGVTLCKENKIDMVLAIGGGSTIDCAKVVAAGAMVWTPLCEHRKAVAVAVDDGIVDCSGNAYLHAANLLKIY